MAEPQQEASEDAVMTRIGQAVMLHRGGDREEARNRFARLWEEIGEGGGPPSAPAVGEQGEMSVLRCILAHYMADTQDDPADELAWDQRALAAVGGLCDERPHDHHASVAVRAFYPSLHLNLAADHVKLGQRQAARAHLERARAACAALADDAYGAGIRAAIGRLELRLAGGADQLP